MFAQRPQNTNHSLLNKCDLIIFWQLNSSFCWRTLRWIYSDEVLFGVVSGDAGWKSSSMQDEHQHFCKHGLICIYLQVFLRLEHLHIIQQMLLSQTLVISCSNLLNLTILLGFAFVCVCSSLVQSLVKNQLKANKSYLHSTLAISFVIFELQPYYKKQLKRKKLLSAQLLLICSKKDPKWIFFFFFF